MSLESEIENQPFAVRRVVLASRWRQRVDVSFQKVETAALKIFCVIIPSLVYTCRDFGSFRVVKPYVCGGWLNFDLNNTNQETRCQRP